MALHFHPTVHRDINLCLCPITKAATNAGYRIEEVNRKNIENFECTSKTLLLGVAPFLMHPILAEIAYAISAWHAGVTVIGTHTIGELPPAPVVMR